MLIPQNSVDRRLVAVFFDRFIELFEHLFLVLRQRAPDADLQHVVEAVIDKPRNVQQLDQAAVLDEVIQLAGRNKASGLIVLIEGRAPVQKERKVGDALGVGAVKKFRCLFSVFHAASPAGDTSHDVGVENKSRLLHPGNLSVGLLQIVVLFGKGEHVVQTGLDADIQAADPLVVQLL